MRLTYGAMIRWASDPANFCTACDKPCAAYNRYCSWCGVGNPNFSEAALIKGTEETLEEASQDCRNGHPLWRAAKFEADKNLERPYCPVCGTKLIESWDK